MRKSVIPVSILFSMITGCAVYDNYAVGTYRPSVSNELKGMILVMQGSGLQNARSYMVRNCEAHGGLNEESIRMHSPKDLIPQGGNLKGNFWSYECNGLNNSPAVRPVITATNNHGQSTLLACDINVAVTSWTNCQGTFSWANGNKYVGEFRGGKPNGQGIGTFANGSKYVGEFRDDYPNGQGTLTWANGDKHVGEFMKGNRHGQGTYTSVNGDKYVGEWRDNKYHGQGILTHSDGRPPLEGVWKDNKFVRAERIPDYIAGRNSPASPALVQAAPPPTQTAPPVAQAPRQAEPPRSTLSLSATASQPDPNGVVTLTIITNSDTASLKINGDEAGGRADGRYSLKRFAQVGDNRFEVVATDRFGNTQRQTVSVVREFVQTAATIPVLNPLSVQAVKQRDAVAIVIGIEKYRSVPAADFANRDASIFVDYATRALGIPRENIRLLLDEKAGAAEILLTFKNWLPTRIKRGSTDVYVFYSGHGLPSEDGSSLFFLPHEANRDLLERTAISQKEIVDAIQRTSPKSVTMFIDSCYSGQSRTGETLLASARPLAVKAKQSSFPSNFTVISASAPDQISSSSPELKHGIFSYYLMRGMEGEADANKDKQITVGEMQTYLSENVTRRAMGMNRTQQPQVVGDTSRVLVRR